MPHFYRYASQSRIMLAKNIAYYAGSSARIIAASLRGGRGYYGGGYGRGRARPKMVLCETNAPLDCQVELEEIPADLNWKFVSNRDPEAQRYWLKLTDEERYRPRPRVGIRETCKAKHQENFRELSRTLEELLKESLKKEKGQGFTLKCEARLGKLAWRDGQDQLDCLKEVFHYRGEEFYTRTTTKTQKMIEKFQSLYAMDGDPTCLIVLQVKVNDPTQGGDNRVFLNENPYGTFTLNIEEGCVFSENVGNSKADFLCIGRSHDVRIAADCKKKEKKSTQVPQGGVRRNIEQIANSVQRTDAGNLKMILRCGCVKIEHVRQKKTWSFTNRAGNRICLYELKESNIRPLYLVEDEVVELEHNDNQEIEVKLQSKEVNDERAIGETLREVNELFDLAMDVEDMAEECRDPAVLY